MRSRTRRLLVLLSFGVFAVALIAGCLHIQHARPVGKGPAGPAVPRELFAEAWTERPVLLVGLGDSITAGFGARRGYGYFARLVSNPPEDSPDMQGITLTAVLPSLEVTNLAVSGSTSLEHVERQLPLLATNEHRLGLVILTTGGNDLIHNYGRTTPHEGAMYGATWEEAQPWLSNFEERLERILSELQSRFPAGCHIFLANIYDPTDGVGDIERAGLPPWKDGPRLLEHYNRTIQRAAEQRDNVHLVDLHQSFLGHGIHCRQFWRPHFDSRDPHYWYYHNLEDPNERGYDAIRRLFLLEMAKAASQWR